MGSRTLKGMTIGVGPGALLFSKAIDTMPAAGVLMADIWKEQRIMTIDMLGDEFLETVKIEIEYSKCELAKSKRRKPHEQEEWNRAYTDLCDRV